MSKTPRKTSAKTPARRAKSADAPPAGFEEVLSLIDAAKTRAVAAVNTTLIDLYWKIGEHISRQDRRATAGARGPSRPWPSTSDGDSRTRRGFSARNLWRMMQFYETYRGQPKLVTTGERIVLDPQPAHPEPLQARGGAGVLPPLCRRERWGKRELERQLAGALFERTVLSPAKLSPAVAELHPDAAAVFKDTLPRRVPRPSAGPFRGRSCSAAWSSS